MGIEFEKESAERKDKQTPVIQRILDRFDPLSGTPYVSHAHVEYPRIKSKTDGYTVRGFDGREFLISTKVAGGILGDADPTRVEFSRIPQQGLTQITVGEVLPIEDTAVRITGGALEPVLTARIERLFLPEDDGFELFEELNQKLQEIGPAITDASGLIGPNVRPEKITYHYKKRPKWEESRLHDETRMELHGGDKRIGILLDAKKEYTNPGKPKEISYLSGYAEVSSDGEETKELDLGVESLIAFQKVHTLVTKLYKDNVSLD